MVLLGVVPFGILFLGVVLLRMVLLKEPTSFAANKEPVALCNGQK